MSASERVRLLLAINSSDEGGGARHLASLVGGLDRSIFRPSVATSGAGPLVRRLTDAGVEVIDVPMMASRCDPRPVARLRRLLREGSFDLVHLHGTRAGFFGTLALSTLLRRPRSVYTVHGLSCSRRSSRPVRALFAAAERFIAGRVDRVISVCESDRRSGIARGILPPERTVTIPNGVDLPPATATFPSGSLRVVTVARLVPQKGIPVLLEAARQVCARRADAQFTIFGEGADRAALEARARRLGLAGKVRFAGVRPDIAGKLGAFDLFVLPSLWEGMPFSLLEAMAAARPVIATAVSGSTELVIDGVTGRLVPPGDPAALSAAILELASGRSEAEAMGRRARERVRRRFHREGMLSSTVSLYRELLGGRLVPAVRLAAGAGR